LKNISLYNISEEIYALQEMLIADGGELTEDHEELEEKVKSLLTLKTDSCVEFVAYEEDMIKLAKEKKKQIDEFVKIKQKGIERFKEYVASCMDKLETKEIKGTIYHVKERKPSQVLIIADVNLVPAHFLTVKTETVIDKAGLKKAIKESGLKIKGIELVDGRRSIQFKLKSGGSK